MRRKFGFLGLIIIVFGISSCETEFSLNGEYELKPIVFGLLDYTDSVHYVKITKAFLGDGDNLVYAQNPDSNYFNQVDAKVIEYDVNGPTGREWPLIDSIITTKEENGVFYAPEQKIYVFHASDLSPNLEYELVADINEGALSISSRTSMISNFKVSGALLLATYKINFANATVNEDKDYTNWSFTVTEGLNAAMYNYKYTIHWTEYYVGGGTAQFEATRNNGDIQQSNKPSNPLVHTAFFSGLDFYQWVGNVVPDNPDVERRTFDGFDLRISVAHEDLNQYMEVSQPVSGLAQVQPLYTNIDGGLGLFSSRIIYELKGFPLDASSIKELCRGGYTIQKLFCSQLPEHASESWFCP